MLWLVIAGFSAWFLAHTAPFPFLLDRFAPRHAIWQVEDEGPPRVYLTYDDGPNPTATPALLDVLAEEGARATFFLIDEHLTEETAPIVRRMFDEGHAVALHAGDRSLVVAEPDEVAARLLEHADRIEQLAGHRPCRLFRPHAGWRSGAMYEGLMQIDYRLVGWSWGLWDWSGFRKPEAEAVARKLARGADAGDIVVMHDGHHEDPAADRHYTVEATRQLVPALQKRGLAFGVLCEPR
jgi:peptidoglycan/xylan/chitin deacetylase (PgdA/CDA1 family)